MTFDEVVKNLDRNVCGVYAIYHTGNPQKAYIGSSKCVRTRLMQHRRNLLNGTHNNFKLRALYKVFGDNEIRCVVLETLESETDARDREQVMLDFLGAERLYNLDKRVYGQSKRQSRR